MYKDTIGLVGGFGGFATLDFFRRLLETFGTGCERDYPRIIMDNDFTMPSRTRALLYDEDIDVITEMIARSVKNLIISGADKIVLVCGTAHWFLDGVYQLIPEAREKIVDIIDVTGACLNAEQVRNCYVIAAEGTMKKKLYDKRFESFGISVSSPEERDWPRVREFLETVKQNRITDLARNDFMEFILDRTDDRYLNREGKICALLGCTELPLLTNDLARTRICFIDPLEYTLDHLRKNLV